MLALSRAVPSSYAERQESRADSRSLVFHRFRGKEFGHSRESFPRKQDKALREKGDKDLEKTRKP